MKLGWLFTLLLLLPSVLGASISDAQTNVTMENERVQIDAVFIVDTDQKINNLTLVTENDPQDVHAWVADEERECSVIENYVRCGSVPNGTTTVRLMYESEYPLAVVGENTILKFSNQLPYTGEPQTITVRLPLGYVIPRETGKSEDFYITPKPSQVYSDGQHIFLEWESERQELAVSVVTKNVAAQQVSLSWVITGIVALAAIGSVAFILRRKKKAPAPEFIDSEQLVVNLLQESENHELWQKQILHETEFSKAKLSRVIRNLEERGVVKKIPYGNTNKIALKVAEE